MDGLIGIGTLIAGYLYQNTGKELTNPIEEYEIICMGKHHQKLLNNLEQLRKSVGLTQRELSIKAEVSRKSINAIVKTYFMFHLQHWRYKLLKR